MKTLEQRLKTVERQIALAAVQKERRGLDFGLAVDRLVAEREELIDQIIYHELCLLRVT